MGKRLRGVCVWLPPLFPRRRCRAARVISHCFTPLSLYLSLLLSTSFINGLAQSSRWDRSHLLYVFCLRFHSDFPIKPDFRWSLALAFISRARSCISRRVWILVRLKINIYRLLIRAREEGKACFQPLCQEGEIRTLLPAVPSQILHHFFIICVFSPWFFFYF